MRHKRHASDLIREFEDVGLSLLAVPPISATSKIRIVGDQSQVEAAHLTGLRESLSAGREAVIAELVVRQAIADLPTDSPSKSVAEGSSPSKSVGGQNAKADQRWWRLATLLTDCLRSGLGEAGDLIAVQVISLRDKPIKAITLQDWIDQTNVHGHASFCNGEQGREVARYYPPTGIGVNPYAKI